MNIKKAIYEHLITKKKYNTLQLKYEVLQDELEKKIVELNTEKRINLKRKEIWTKTLKDQEAEIISLRKRKPKNDSNNKERK